MDDHSHLRRLPEDAELGIRTAPVDESLVAPRPPNVRRSSITLKVFFLTVFVMIDCFALAAWYLHNFYESNIEPRLSDNKTSQAAFDGKLAKLQAQIDDLRFVQVPKEDPVAAAPQISLVDGQIARMQTQINSLRAQHEEVNTQLQKLAAPPPKADSATHTELAAALEKVNRLQANHDALAAQLTAAEGQIKKLESTPPPSEKPISGNQIGSIVSVTSDAGQELRILKERNRLTLFADQALATASSKAMSGLWQTIRDPDLAFVKDGAVAEIVRVQHFYSSMPGLPPSYRLPVDKLFKGAGLHAESDLKTEQITKLLLDDAQPPEIRVRSAMILTGHKDKNVGDALLSAMRHDPSLLVVKAAQNALQDTFELYAPRLFDTVGMEKAWQEWLNSHPTQKK